jgi:hypothetical protein
VVEVAQSITLGDHHQGVHSLARIATWAYHTH